MDEDVHFPRFVPLRQKTFKNFCGAKIKMSTTTFQVFVALVALCCATAGKLSLLLQSKPYKVCAFKFLDNVVCGFLSL